MNIILWIIFGGLVGWIANMIVRVKMSVLASIIVGIIGAIMGGFLMNAFGAPGVTGFNLTSLIVSVLGAIVLLFFVRLFRPRNIENPTKSAQEKKPTLVAQFPSKIEEQNVPRVQEKPRSGVADILKSLESKRKSPSVEKETLPGNIFVSYRRTDSADVAGRIYDRLVGSFGKAAIFKDVDSIPLGYDFKEYLGEKVSECNVLLAIIGDRWLEASDSTGRKRLEDPADFVRIEIESALARGILVIPLLVRGASMPAEEELPGTLKKLVFRNGTQIRSDPDFHRDMDRLIAALKQYIETTKKQ